MSVEPPLEDGGRTPPTPPRRVSTRAFTVGALVFAVLVACVVSLFASHHPDGLEFVAGAAGFLDTARDSAAAGGPLAGYGVRFLDDPLWSAVIAGALGCLATFGLASLAARIVRRRGPRP